MMMPWYLPLLKLFLNFAEINKVILDGIEVKEKRKLGFFV